MGQFGSAAFRQYTQGYLRMRTLEAELARELAVQRAHYRASLIEPTHSADQSNLSSVFAYHRTR